tara:strand:- start:97 stop:1002 length:906 start_codon:yes stop_codon:yes gene_type:complete
MIERGYGYKTKVHKKAKKIKLSTEQKDLIVEYARDKLSSLQIAQLIFQDREVKNLSMEQRVVADFLKVNSPDYIRPDKEVERVEYKPPETIDKVLKMVNEYSHQELDLKKLKRYEKECLDTTKKYLSSPRFVQLMNNYNCEDSNLFQAEYIRAVWDKPDLTADEINLYINVCVDYVNLKTIQRNMEKINQMFDEVEDQTEMSVKLAEILKAKSAEYHQCEQRQESLIKKLNGDRSARMKNKQDKFASLLNLVQSFQEEEERNRMIEIAEKQKLLVEDEVDKIEDMESWKSRVLGLRKEDVL